MKRYILSILSFCFLLYSGCTSVIQKLGTKENPIKLFFTPSVEAETITENSVGMIQFLEKETGLYFKVSVPTNYITVVESFGSERADIAVMNSFGYILANKKYNATAELKILRHGSSYYKGQILASVASGINTIEDIEGKRMAYTDPSSTSGYLLPSKMFKEKKITPANTVFGMKHDNVVTMIYQGQVDAGATYYSPPGANGEIRDARSRVLTQFPDVESKIKIVALTDSIPNDPIVFRKGIEEEIKGKIKNALLKYIQMEDGKKVFKTIYGIDGLVEATDADYRGLRDMVEEMKIDIGTTLK